MESKTLSFASSCGSQHIFSLDKYPVKVTCSDDKIKYDIHEKFIAINILPTKENQEHTLTIEFEDGDSIKYIIPQKGIEIKKGYSVKPSVKTTITYNGLPNSVFIAHGIAQSGTILYKLDDGNWTTDPESIKVTNPGEYTVWYRILLDDESEYGKESKKVTVIKEKAIVTKAPTPNNGVLSAPHSLCTSGTASGGSMLYKLGDNGTWSSSIPSVSAAGNYIVYYKAKGDATHDDSDEKSITVVVTSPGQNPTPTPTYYTVTVTPSEGGTATANPTSVVSGGKVTLTATPNAGYTFDGWYSGTTKVSGNATYSITVTTNLTLEAKFKKIATNDVTVYVGQWQGLKSVFNATPIDELIANATPHTFSDTLALDFTATKNTFYFIYPTDKVECTKFQYMGGVLNNLLDGNVYNISRTDGNYTTLGSRSTTVTEDNPLTYNIAFKTK